MFERITPPPLPGAALGSIEPFWVAVNRYNDNGQLRRSRVFYRNVIGNIPEGHPDYVHTDEQLKRTRARIQFRFDCPRCELDDQRNCQWDAPQQLSRVGGGDRPDGPPGAFLERWYAAGRTEISARALIAYLWP